jgi:HEAT repeat protein
MSRWIAPSFLLVALAFWVLRPAPPADPPAPPPGVASAWRLQPGVAYRYHLVLQGEKHVPGPMGQGALTGRIDFDVEVELRAYPALGAHQPVGLRFAALRTHDLALLEQPVLPDRATAESILQGREVLLDFDRRGVLVSLRYAPEDPPVFKHLAQLVAQEIAVVIEPGAATWIAHEPTQHGMAVSEYAVTSADGLALQRRRTTYRELVGVPDDVAPEVEGVAQITFAPAGHLTHLRAQEHAQAGETFWLDGRLVLELLETKRFSGFAPPLVAAEIRHPGQVPVSDAALRKAMQERAAGLTTTDLLADLARVGAGGGLADKNRWLWRASALLRLHPELADDLADLILAPETGHDGRALALDLLVSVGHSRAQAAVRRALAGDFSDDPEAHTLYARLGFIQKPEPATADFVARRFAGTEGEDRTAWAYTLGAVADHLEPAEALALTRPLATELAAAEGPDAQRHLLRALGNAGLEAHVPVVAAYAQAEDARVRKAAVGALRKCTDAQSEALLTERLTDVDVDVQQAAARALARRDLTAEHFATFAEQVRSGQLQEGAWPELLDALRAHQTTDPEGVRALLEAMLERPITHPRLRARIRSLLG